MSPKQQSVLRTWITGVAASVSGALLIAAIWLLVDMRDFVKYKQPNKDAEQDRGIVTLQHNFTLSDSMNCAKNKATQSRVDNMQDVVRTINMKLDVLIDQNHDAKEKIEEMSKYFKQDNLANE